MRCFSIERQFTFKSPFPNMKIISIEIMKLWINFFKKTEKISQIKKIKWLHTASSSSYVGKIALYSFWLQEVYETRLFSSVSIIIVLKIILWFEKCLSQRFYRTFLNKITMPIFIFLYAVGFLILAEKDIW